MKTPITQSEAWAKLQKDLGEKAVFQKTEGYQFLAIIKRTPVGNYLYCPYGPVAEDKASFRSALNLLIDVAKEYEAIFVRIEPQNLEFGSCLPKNAHKSKELNPKDTWILDLTAPEETFIAKLPNRLLRYHRTAGKKGIIIRKTKNPEEITHLVRLQNNLAKEKGIKTFSENYLKTELSQPFATLYLAEYEERDNASTDSEEQCTGYDNPLKKKEIVAAGLVFDDATTRYNLQGAQSDLGRHLHATGILTIELIVDARKKGLKHFDFWGIAPEGAPDNHPWAAFTSFKKTFHGEARHYLGTYDLPLNLPKYEGYKLLRSINRIKRKAIS